MAQSVKIDFHPWSQFDHHSYDIMHQDFIHNNLLKINVNVLSNKGKVRLQQNLIQTKNNKFTTKGQTNIFFPLKQNKSLYVQIKNKAFRIHYDNGLLIKKHMLYNFYGSAQYNRNLQNSMFKLGCQSIAQNWKLNFRYRYSQQYQAAHTLYSRWRIDYKNFTFQGIKALNLMNFNLLKCCVLLGYYKQNQTLHFRLGNDQYRNQYFNWKHSTIKQYFDHFMVNYTRTLNQNQRIGIQTGIDPSTYLFKGISIVCQDYDALQHRTLKLRLNSNMNGAISLRNKMGSYGTYLLGVGIDEIGNKNNIKFGMEIDFNL